MASAALRRRLARLEGAGSADALPPYVLVEVVDYAVPEPGVPPVLREVGHADVIRYYGGELQREPGEAEQAFIERAAAACRQVRPAPSVPVLTLRRAG